MNKICQSIKHSWELIALALLLSFASGVSASTLQEVRMWRAPDHTRLVFDLSDAVSYNLFTLENPRRVVIDIADATQVDDLSGLDFAGSPITGVRSAVRNDNALRIVLDLNAKHGAQRPFGCGSLRH
jgi:N-acetylmuramoyl-L-alanine amidase